MNPLDQLKDIHLPQDPSWWPPAIGWWVLLLLLSVLVWLLIRALNRWLIAFRRRRYTHRILRLIERHYQEGGNAGASAAELSKLLRRACLGRHPREAVAGLSGQRWLEFLDRSGKTQEFTRGPGRLLVSAPYMRTCNEELHALFSLARGWLKKNV